MAERPGQRTARSGRRPERAAHVAARHLLCGDAAGRSRGPPGIETDVARRVLIQAVLRVQKPSRKPRFVLGRPPTGRSTPGDARCRARPRVAGQGRDVSTTPVVTDQVHRGLERLHFIHQPVYVVVALRAEAIRHWCAEPRRRQRHNVLPRQMLPKIVPDGFGLGVSVNEYDGHWAFNPAPGHQSRTSLRRLHSAAGCEMKRARASKITDDNPEGILSDEGRRPRHATQARVSVCRPRRRRR